MRKLFLVFGSLLLLIVLLAGGLVSTLILRPQWIINVRNLERITQRINGNEKKITWGMAEVRAVATDWRRKEFQFKFSGLCFNMTNLGLHGCFEQFQLGLKFKIGKPAIVETIGPVIMKTSDFEVTLKPKSKKANEKSTFKLSDWVSISHAELDHILVEIKNFHFREPGQNLEFNLSLNDDKHRGYQAPWDLFLRATLKKIPDQDPKAAPLKIATNLVLRGESDRLSFPFAVSGPFSLDAGPKTRIRSRIRANLRETEDWPFKINVQLITSAVRYQGDIDGKYSKDFISGAIKGFLSTKAVAFDLGQNEPCHFELHFKGLQKLDCVASFAKASETLPQQQLLKALYGIQAHVTADLTTAFPPDPDNEWKGKVGVEILTFRKKFSDIHGSVQAELKPARLSKDLLENLSVDGNIVLDIIDFAKMVTVVEGSKLVPPAPINALKGELTLQVKGRLIPGKEDLPFSLTTRLASRGQSFDVDSQGSFGFVQRGQDYVPQLKGVATLSDIQLVLPRLGLAKPPPITPDKRILAAKELKELESEVEGIKAPPGFYYDLSLKTAKPIRLITNLADAPVPVAVDLYLTEDTKPMGTVAIQEFPLTLFKGKGRIQHFILKFGDPEVIPIDGEASVERLDYKIKVLLSGTTAAPHIRFESDPPLPEDQVLAALLYGKTVNDLDPDQQSSVGSAQAAIGDKAMQLSSFFLLASTPVESISYNSEKQLYSAKVKLDEGVSLDVGSDQTGVRELGVNKRLGHNWTIRTYLNNPSESEQRSVTAFLEWFRKY